MAGDIDYFYIAFAKNEDGNAGTTYLDNLSLTSVVPEPSTFILAAVGLLGLLASGRRRKR